MLNKLIACHTSCVEQCDRYLQPMLLLAIRAYVALVFFQSGLTKIQDWSNTRALFRDEFSVPLLPPDLAAVLGTAGELLLPPLLVLGLLGRLPALGLFFVNLMAVLSYPALFHFECPAAVRDHFFWGVLLLVIVAFGPGKLALERYIKCRHCNPSQNK